MKTIFAILLIFAGSCTEQFYIIVPAILIGTILILTDQNKSKQ